MADVFISYVAENSRAAIALSEGLERAGYSTWCYERHSVPGPSYLAQTRAAIEACRVFLVLVSTESLGSNQIGIEVVRAHETNKRFLPILRDVTHTELHTRQPEWGQAAGGATSIHLRGDNVAEILPRIISGLALMDVDRATEPSPQAPITPAPRRGFRRRARVGAAVGAALVVVALATVIWQGRSRPVAPPPPIAHQQQVTVRGADGAEMVLVAAGEFWIGGDEYDNEKPRHRVYLDAFYIDKYEMTNLLYRSFMAAMNHPPPAYWTDARWNGDHQPVVGVSWQDADSYCRWTGKSLPTEAQWEKAARGSDGRKYPWGETWSSAQANSSESKLGKTADVGSYTSGASPYGAMDLAGNAWEWVADWFDEGYYKQSPDRNPSGPDSGQLRSLRGGSGLNHPVYLRTSARYSLAPEMRPNNVGFRCAKRP